MVELLKTTHLFLIGLNVPGNYQNGPTIDLGIHNPCHSMYNAWAANDKADPWPSSKVTVRLSRITSTLFITKCNETYSQCNTSFGNFDNRDADDTKNDLDLQRT